jgi:hypothetical protein
MKFKLDNITKGALRYQEIDDQGRALEGDEGNICTVYFRKATFGKISATWASTGQPPKTLNLTVEEAK